MTKQTMFPTSPYTIEGQNYLSNEVLVARRKERAASRRSTSTMNTHAIVCNETGTYSVALIGGISGSIITTWGNFPTYFAACDSAQRDSAERHGHSAILGTDIIGAS